MKNETICVGEIEAEPGTKTFDYLPIRLPTEVRTSIPVGLINGEKDGPVLCLLAGHHGMEYPGIEAVIRTYNKIDPKELRGSIISVPVVNMLGFQKRTAYLCPVDGVNIARIYPGNPNGSLAYVIAHTVLNEIVSKADYAMDHHGADIFESLAPFTLFCTGSGNKAVIAKAEGMAKAFGLNYRAHERSGMTLMEEAPKLGIPMLLAEIGGVEWNEPSVTMHTTGIENVMKHLGMIEGTPKPQLTEPPRQMPHKTYGVRTRSGGMWYPRVKAGDKISENEIVGETRDLDGSVKETLRSPCNGVVTFLWTYHVLDPGFQIMTIAKM